MAENLFHAGMIAGLLAVIVGIYACCLEHKQRRHRAAIERDEHEP